VPRDLPSYRHYQPKNLGQVVLDNHQHSLDKYSSPDSIAEHNRLRQEWIAGGPSSRSGAAGDAASDRRPGPIAEEVILASSEHAES
jgi:hypothetical protein